MSTKLEKILTFDKQVLADCGVYDVDGEGFMSYLDDGKFMPVTIDKKRLCLATAALVKANDWTHRIPFSPLSEQTNQGPSPVLNATKNYMWAALSAAIRVLAVELLALAADTQRQKSLPEKASIYIASMGGADAKTVKTLENMLARLSDAPERRLLTMYLKNGGKGGALRTCEVSFPILDDAYSNDPSKFFGVDMPRKTKDKAILVSLFEYILGDKDVRETHSQVSNDGEAPYYHSLLLTFNKLAARFQRLVDLHKDACPELESVKFTLDWTETLENFATFVHDNGAIVPPLPGNRGLEKDTEAEKRTNVYETPGAAVGADLPFDPPYSTADRREERDRAYRETRERREPERSRSYGREPERDYDRGSSLEVPLTRPDSEDGVKRISSSTLLNRGRDNGRDSGRNDRGRGGRSPSRY